MKKIWTWISVVVLFSTCFFSLMSCKQTGGTQNDENTSAEEYYLTLNAYEITLGIEDTFSLDVKKFSKEGDEKEVKQISYTSDAPKIATIENGVIKGLQKGETYVHVTADEQSVSCFVTVDSLSETKSGLVIGFASNNLYCGIVSQAYATILQDGREISVSDVEWSVEDDAILSISQTGEVTPKQVVGATKIFAACEYAGESYSAELQVSILEPCYYAFSSPSIKLATATTLSGKVNSSYTATKMTVVGVNILTGAVTKYTAAEFTISDYDETVANFTTSANGEITVSSVAVGETYLTAHLTDLGQTIQGKVEVVTAISGIADMDILALACHSDKPLLGESYMLVNDIDYENDVIYPIAPFTDNLNARTPGIQWKYRLKKTSGGYAFEERENFGKAGYGLTDEEFKTFAQNGGLNPKNGLSFSGNFDGNGHSIKNAKLFYGITTLNVAGSYNAAYSNIFGQCTGTIKNVSFENISLQDPKDVVIEGSDYGLDRMYVNASTPIIDGGLRKTADGEYYYRGASLIGRGNGCVVKNVYFELTCNLKSDAFAPGALICWGSNSVNVSNCVVSVNDPEYRTKALNGAGAKTAGTFMNNLAIGVLYIEEEIRDSQYGQNGNWWTKTLAWQDIFWQEAGGEAVNLCSLEQTLSTFDANVWDMSEFASTKEGRPILIKGCSVG
ncbi:MAG: hypothetical protein IJX91_03240 [Clostridia bacterium]|nr:hypothetical protein [Clostridia bacterium]